MTPVQIVGVLIAFAGIVWMFVHPGAKGEGEASYAGVTLKSLTQGGVTLVVGALLIALVRDSEKGGEDLTLSAWAMKANEICSEGFEDIRALNIPSEGSAQFEAIPRVAPISGRINQRLQAIGRPSGAEAQVDHLLALASEQNVEARRAYDLWRGGDRAGAQTALSEAQRLYRELQLLDGQLGANICALGP